MKKQLARLQWQFIRHSLVGIGLISFFFLFLITYEDNRGLLLAIDRQILGVPILMWMVVIVLLTGLISGYIQANPMKRKIDQLIHGAVRFERGTFSHRIEVEGDDELAELSERMNGMS